LINEKRKGDGGVAKLTGKEVKRREVEESVRSIP